MGKDLCPCLLMSLCSDPGGRECSSSTSGDVGSPLDVEVFHLTQKSCNASIACHMLFLAGYGPDSCPLGINHTVCFNNME